MDYISKHHWLFYILQWTWGILLNIYGLFVALAMLISGHKPHKFGPYVYFECGKNWGGMECGMFFVIGKYCANCAPHECGHGLQNIMFGPIQVIWSIGSAFRYWYRRWYTKHRYPKTHKMLPDYDAWWVEGQATSLGTQYFGKAWWEHWNSRD